VTDDKNSLTYLLESKMESKYLLFSSIRDKNSFKPIIHVGSPRNESSLFPINLCNNKIFHWF